ncbi:MAG: prolyl oligopeptidase family serine peptidase [Hyphomonadaceae bacterium]|nr:prolyl oligopeptidase family serine peptidase [Hyphomonadaceae bacterium]
MKSAFAWLAFAALAVFGAPAAAQTGRTPIPLDAMVREPAMSQMQLSPDGAHLAALTSLDGENVSISVWETANLSRNPTRIGMGGTSARSAVRIESITWVSNDRLLVIMSQPIIIGSGPDSRTYTALARFVKIDGSEFVEPLAQGGARTELERFVDKFLTISLVDQLPDDERHILMAHETLDGSSVYRVDVVTGAGERVMELSETQGIVPVTDSSGELRVLQFADTRNGEYSIGFQIRDSGSAQWREPPALTYPARARRNLAALGFDPQNQDTLIVLDSEGQNFSYLRGFSVSRGTFTETMFQHPRYDIANVLMDRPGNGEPTSIIGFTYLGATETPFYDDPTYRAIYDGLRAQLPGRDIRIGSRKGRYRIIMAESSRHPPEYFLMTDDRAIQRLGVSYPNIPSDQLADTELVYYNARDGLRIPAFLTLPYGWRRGDAPLPVIIQPHGGPWGRNDASWGGSDIPVTQYFASRGYAVLQPQFRGSTGWGDQLWRAGDGQWGMAMQDDKDDGLAWLVSEGIADPERAVIYGFSYGGFAAMAATVRPNSPYRCAISGAGVSSLQRLGMLWRENRIQRLLQGVTVAGMDPLEHAGDANIPILVYGGDRDQTAPLWHSTRFADALRSRGKTVKYEVIRDMPHGAMTPDMRRQEFTLVENYLRNDCGITN